MWKKLSLALVFAYAMNSGLAVADSFDSLNAILDAGRQFSDHKNDRKMRKKEEKRREQRKQYRRDKRDKRCDQHDHSRDHHNRHR